MRNWLSTAGLVVLLVGGPYLGWGATINLAGSLRSPTLTTDAAALAAWQPSPQELWLAFADPLVFGMTTDEERRYGLVATEQLDVTGGHGVRFVFEQPHTWAVSQQNNQWVLTRANLSKVSTTSPPGVIVLQDQWLLSTTQPIGAVMQVMSRQQGGRYQVVPHSQAVGWQEEQAFHGVTLQPSLMGSVWQVATPVATLGRQAGGLTLALPNIPVQQPVVASQPKAEPVEVLTQSPALSQATAKLSEPVTAAATTLAALVPVETPAPTVVDTVFAVSSTLVPVMVDVAGQKIKFDLPESYYARQDAIQAERESRQRAFARAVGSVENAAVMAEQAVPSVPAQQQVEDVRVAIPRSEVFLVRLGTGDAGDDYRTLEAKRWQEVLDAKSPTARYKSRLELARLALTFNRPVQAEGVLRSLPVGPSGLPRDGVARTLLGMALVLQNRPVEAIVNLERLGGPEQHRQLWLAAAYEQVGRPKEALDRFESSMDASRVYPFQFQEYLRLAEGRALLLDQDYNALFERMDELALLAPKAAMPPMAKYLKAKAYLALQEEEQGLRRLAEVAESEDPLIAYQAKYEFVSKLSERGELSDTQLIQFLEDLALLWRGDEVERNILFDLGKLYRKQEDFRKSLTRLKTFAESYYDAPQIVAVTELMKEEFLQVFNHPAQGNMDDLGLLGFYYDFRELTPADQTGDAILAYITEQLARLNLFTRAIQLVETQLKYREEDAEKQARLAITLAQLQRKARLFDAARRTLVQWPPVGDDAKLMADYALEKSRILLEMAEYDTAKQLVTGQDTVVARNILVDAAWAQDDFKEVIRLLTPVFADRNHPGLADTRTRADFVRLAYAYTRFGQREILTNLTTRYQAELKNFSETLDVLHVFAAQVGVEKSELALENGARPLQQVAAQTADFHDFRARYNAQVEDRAEEKKARRIFNSKVNPELLSPPSL